MQRCRITYLSCYGDDLTTHELTTTIFGHWPDTKQGIREVYEETWHNEFEEYEKAILEVELL